MLHSRQVSVYHPLLRRLIPLATMEVEHTRNVELFRQVLTKVSGVEMKTFNPVGGWCTVHGLMV